MSNEVQSSKFKDYLSFKHLTLIWYLNFVIWIFLLTLSVGLLFWNWTAWHSTLIGIIALTPYFGVNVVSWGAVVERALPLSRAWARLFGFLVGFYLTTFAISIPVVIWIYDRLAVAGAMLAVGVVGIILSLRVPDHPPAPSSVEEGEDTVNVPPPVIRRGLGGGRTRSSQGSFCVLKFLFDKY